MFQLNEVSESLWFLPFVNKPVMGSITATVVLVLMFASGNFLPYLANTSKCYNWSTLLCDVYDQRISPITLGNIGIEFGRAFYYGQILNVGMCSLRDRRVSATNPGNEQHDSKYTQEKATHNNIAPAILSSDAKEDSSRARHFDAVVKHRPL